MIERTDELKKLVRKYAFALGQHEDDLWRHLDYLDSQAQTMQEKERAFTHAMQQDAMKITIIKRVKI